jgi:MraZ protein
MLLGEYEHTIDDKNRLTLPARFRQELEGGVVLTRGMDRCVYAYPRAGWDRLVETRLGPLDPLSPDGRAMARFFLAGATETDLDKQGRVMLTPALIRHGDLGREVTVTGLGDHLEIWDRATWAEQLKTLERTAEHVAERLATDHR